MTDWPGIVRRCVGENAVCRDELHLLLKLISRTVDYYCLFPSPDAAGGGAVGDTVHVMKGALEGLVECLCHELPWLSPDAPLADQAPLRDTINGLYELALVLCARSQDLPQRAKLEAICKIAANLEKFTSLFAVSSMSGSIIDERDSHDLLEVLRSAPISKMTIQLLVHVCGAPWIPETPRLGGLLVEHLARLQQDQEHTPLQKRRAIAGILHRLESGTASSFGEAHALEWKHIDEFTV